MTPTGRIAPPAEDGFALIEILVSALVIALVAAGVMGLLQATARSAADQRSHAVAYAVAQEDQARLRSLRLSYLNRLNEKREISIDGSEFTIESQGVFVNNSTRQPSACTSGTTAADYIRITSTVTWPGSRVPVVMKSIVSPSNGSLDPNHGTLVVTVKNAKSEVLSGSVGLSGSGPANFSGSTDSTGCANFADLPTGTYSVTASGTNLVGTNGLPPQATPIGVSAATTSSLDLQYDLGASMPFEFEHRIGSGSTFKAAKIDSVFVSNTLGTGSYWTPAKTRELSLTAKPIFPFKNAVSIWAGSCQGNNPGLGPAMGTYTFKPGEVVTTPMKLQVPALEITVKNGSSLVSNATVMITDENCNDPTTGSAIMRTYKTEASGHQSSASNGQPEYGIPFGIYKICASGTVSGSSRRIYAKTVKVESLTSTTAKSLDLSGSGSEKNQTCP